jgi:beta-glucosidase
VGENYVWTGELIAPETGYYDIKIQMSNGVVKISLDGGKTQLLDAMSIFNPHKSAILTRDGLDNATVRVHLNAGEKRSVRLEAK